jgi:RNA polymerase sigma factor (sigma-70 family)
MSEAVQRPTIFIVDDDAAVRDSLQLLLGLRGYATRSFANGEEFLAGIGSDARGCVLLDLRMAEMGGLAVQTELAKRGVNLPVVILTAHGDVATTRTALRAGAFDFLEKPIEESILLATLEAALAREAELRVDMDRQAMLESRLARLTPRERQVLKLVVEGRHNREVAAALGISPRTVEVYKARIMDKMQVTRLADLIRLALDLDLRP